MSRLVEAETRFANAMKALEGAIESRLPAPSTPAQPDQSAAAADGIDPSKLRAELARIDGEVSRAMQLIAPVGARSCSGVLEHRTAAGACRGTSARVVDALGGGCAVCGSPDGALQPHGSADTTSSR